MADKAQFKFESIIKCNEIKNKICFWHLFCKGVNIKKFIHFLGRMSYISKCLLCAHTNKTVTFQFFYGKKITEI